MVNVPEWLAPYCLIAKGSGSGDVVRSYFNDSSLKVDTETMKITPRDGCVVMDYEFIRNDK
jgi:hypothetical protein